MIDLHNKAGIEVFGTEDLATTLVHNMNKRVSQVIKSNGDSILR